jgi:hypothetical protein
LLGNGDEAERLTGWLKGESDSRLDDTDAAESAQALLWLTGLRTGDQLSSWLAQHAGSPETSDVYSRIIAFLADPSTQGTLLEILTSDDSDPVIAAEVALLLLELPEPPSAELIAASGRLREHLTALHRSSGSAEAICLLTAVLVTLESREALAARATELAPHQELEEEKRISIERLAQIERSKQELEAVERQLAMTSGDRSRFLALTRVSLVMALVFMTVAVSLVVALLIAETHLSETWLIGAGVAVWGPASGFLVRYAYSEGVLVRPGSRSGEQ